ncbi:MAG: sigma-54-dependent Fis family transcriptional regulator [Alphaproteobacteria bacterium]|nr:sigma-54-dependent Fis family transcriptional regulator [Alphaproteobacteria bacterium]MBF0249076.1 sigma-54-dependent Fis family transcriptional regulator [Alphaproteobacteria bacterium]
MAQDILIVDDEADIRSLVAGILEDEGYHPREAGSDAEALEMIEKRRPGLVLLDIWLQGSQLDGLQILSSIKKRHPTLPVVMMSGHGTIETAVKAIQDGAYDFIEKPFKTDRLVLVVDRAVEAARLRRENEELRQRTDTGDELIGTSSAISHLRQAVERVALTNSRVLITGPSGSGKEVVARMLHDRSSRATGPFVVVNCATMEPERMETELFGTETPVDDGEGGRKVGYFESAHMGTLFLDEVTDMPIETQGKIVRVLQEQIFERVGSTTKVEVDVRVVASASHDLQDEIRVGRFREDLFYRLSVVPIDVPPLTRRRDDIPMLAAHFMAQASRRTGQPPRKLSEDAVAALQSYDWPGNVRELKNIIERLLIMAPGGADESIRADHLPGEVTSNGLGGGGLGGAEFMGLPLKQAREVFEREYLNAQVTRFGGNISRTAEFVGMERSALHRKLKTLGLGADGGKD